MKILEKKDYKAWRHEFTCVRCESKLEAEYADVRAQHHEGWSDPRDNSGAPSYWTYHAKCPVCDQDHSIDEKLVPKAMQHECQQKYHRSRTGYFDR